MIKRPNLERTPNYDLTFDLMGRQLAQKLREAVNSKGISATGNLANSFIYDENEGVVKFLKYGEIVDGGRRSGGFPPIRPIVEWINAKGISTGNKTDEQVAFAIAKTIEKRGYRPQPFIQPTISELEQRFALQKELDKLNELQIQGAFKTQEEYNQALLNLQLKYQEKDKEIKDKYDAEELQRKIELRQKTLELAGSAFGALSELAGSFNTKNEKDARKQFQVQKAFNLAAAITNTGMAVTGALTAGGNPIKLATGMQFVEAGIAATVGAANIIKIANSRFGGGAGGGGNTDVPNPAAGGGMTAQFNTIGTSGINQLATLQQQPVQAYVVSGEVTSAQSLDRNRVQNATL